MIPWDFAWRHIQDPWNRKDPKPSIVVCLRLRDEERRSWRPIWQEVEGHDAEDAGGVQGKIKEL